MFLILGTFHSFPTPARPLWAPPPLTSGRGARTSGQACSVLSDQRSRAALLTFDCAHKSLESLLPCESELLGLGWSLRVCSANKLPGDAAAAGPGWHFEEPGKVVGSPAMSVISQDSGWHAQPPGPLSSHPLPNTYPMASGVRHPLLPHRNLTWSSLRHCPSSWRRASPTHQARLMWKEGSCRGVAGRQVVTQVRWQARPHSGL